MDNRGCAAAIIRNPKSEIRNLAEELAAIRYFVNARGLLQIEKKEDMKRRLGRSPDRADMLATLFDSAYAAVACAPPAHREPTEREKLIAEMSRW